MGHMQQCYEDAQVLSGDSDCSSYRIFLNRYNALLATFDRSHINFNDLFFLRL